MKEVDLLEVANIEVKKKKEDDAIQDGNSEVFVNEEEELCEL